MATARLSQAASQEEALLPCGEARPFPTPHLPTLIQRTKEVEEAEGSILAVAVEADAAVAHVAEEAVAHVAEEAAAAMGPRAVEGEPERVRPLSQIHSIRSGISLTSRPRLIITSLCRSLCPPHPFFITMQVRSLYNSLP